MALKDVPTYFRTDSEAEVRLAVAKFFLELDFLEEELSLEDHFSVQLGHKEVPVNSGKSNGKLSGFSDLLITHNCKNLAIVETKHPNLNLTEEDVEQAVSYARLLKQIPPYAIITNGSREQTKVYDVIQFVEIDIPTACVWHQNGQQYGSIGQQDRDDAARKLFRFSPRFVKAFFEAQMKLGMSELKGDISSERDYTPELFVPRSQIENQFCQWLNSDAPAFAIVGDSGTGKTNSMCNLAESASEQHLVLFYQARRLTGKLIESVQEDLAWEFRTDKHISFFIERFVELATSTESQIIIFVDGLDEYAGDKHLLLNDLIKLIQRLEDLPIRLCVSCKSFDWSFFTSNGRESFNHLALSTFPRPNSTRNLQGRAAQRAKHIGTHIDIFSTDEKERAFQQYKAAFNLSGELAGDLYKVCDHPLILKLVAKIYQDSHLPVSGSFSNIEIIEKYIDSRLDRIDRTRQMTARRILNTLATLSTEEGTRSVAVETLETAMRGIDDVTRVFYELVRLNFLVLNESDDEATFRFEVIRTYIYTVMAQKWHAVETMSTIHDIQKIFAHALGRETIEFYFTHIDRGLTTLLSDIALQNFDLYSRLTSELELRSSISDLSPEQQSKTYMDGLIQFADAHTKLKRAYFPKLTTRICPYSDNPTGVVISEYGTSMQLRECTDQIPHPIVVLEEDYAASLYFGRQGDPQKYGARGTVYWGGNKLAKALPQKVAWDMILKDVSKALKDRNLNESDSPLILQERIWDYLIYRPNVWVDGEPDAFKAYYELLGYTTPDDITEIPITTLQAEFTSLIASKAQGFSDANLSARLRRAGLKRISEMEQLWSCLVQITDHCATLEEPRFSRDNLLAVVRGRDRTHEAQKVISTLIDLVLLESKRLLRASFPNFVDRFNFYRANTDWTLLVEVAFEPTIDQPWLLYAFLPSKLEIPDNRLVFFSRDKSEWKLNYLPLRLPRQNGVSYGGHFGIANLDFTVAGISIQEPNATVYKTRLDIVLPITSQVYQLIGVEANKIFAADWPTFTRY